MVKEKCLFCFKAISVPARFKIFEYLKDREGEKVTIKELSVLTGLRQPTVTHHANELARAGLVRKERRGRETWCLANQICADCPIF